MNNNYEDTRSYLMENCEEFKKHYEEHKAIHEKIDEIQKKLIVSDSERMSIKSLKKQKLFLKDKMEEMIYKHIKSNKDKNTSF